MNEIETVRNQLPATLDELAKFVLIGREKLNSVRAEIKAIDTLELAQEVREQKKTEAQMLGAALLDAEVKLGELFQEMETRPGERVDIKNEPRCSGATRLENKSKTQRIAELGFEKTQAHRFEVLAKNPDVVDFVKKEAEENEDIPTRSRVLQLVRQKKSPEWKYKATRQVNDAIFKAAQVDTDAEKLDTWWNSLSGDAEQRRFVIDLDEAMKNLVVIRNFVIGKLGGKTRWAK